LPQVSKEGYTGKNSTDSMTSKPRLGAFSILKSSLLIICWSLQFWLSACAGTGSREDDTFAFGDYKDEISDGIKDDHSNYLESPSYGKYSRQYGLDSKAASSHSYRENKLTTEGNAVQIHLLRVL